MPKLTPSIKKTSLSPVEQYELNQWLEQNQVNSSNLRRSFTDVLPLARLLARYYPELIDLNYYPPRNSVQNKLCNWESFNKRVLERLGVHLTRDQMVRVARSVPGSVDMLLHSIMRVQMTAEQKAREAKESTTDEDEVDETKPENEDEDETENEQDNSKATAAMPKTLKQAQAVLRKRTESIVSSAPVTTRTVPGGGLLRGAIHRTRPSAAIQGRNRKSTAGVNETLSNALSMKATPQQQQLQPSTQQPQQQPLQSHSQQAASHSQQAASHSQQAASHSQQAASPSQQPQESQRTSPVTRQLNRNFHQQLRGDLSTLPAKPISHYSTSMQQGVNRSGQPGNDNPVTKKRVRLVDEQLSKWLKMKAEQGDNTKREKIGITRAVTVRNNLGQTKLTIP